MTRFFALGALLALFIAPTVATAADKDGPEILLRVQSVDQILDNAEYVAKLIGQEESAKQFVGFIRALAGEKGIEGIDPKRPFVAYANLAEDIKEIKKSEIVVMVPIADKESFIDLLKNRVALEIKEEKNGLYSTEVPNIGSVYFRFENKYVYGTLQNKDNIDVKKLPKPETIIGKFDSVLALSLHIDRVPKALKQYVLAEADTALDSAKQQKLPGELEKLEVVKNKAIESLAGGLKSILFEGKELTLKLDVDPKKDDLSISLELTALEGTELAKDIADLKTKKSVALGGAAVKNAALMLTLNASLPTSVKKVFAPAVDELVKQGLDMAGDFKEVLEPVVKALMPTIKAGELDIGAAVVGPDANNLLSGVVIVKVAEGKNIEKAIKDLVEKIPEPIKSAIVIDEDSAGDHKIHMIKVKDQLEDKIKKVIGETDLYLAIRNDALIISFGPQAKTLIKDTLKSAPTSGPLFKAEVAVHRIVSLVEGQDAKAAQRAAKESFGAKGSGDSVSITLEGGDALRLKASIKGKVIQFIALMEKYKGDN